MSRSSSVHRLNHSISKSVLDTTAHLEDTSAGGVVSEGNRRRAEMLLKLK